MMTVVPLCGVRFSIDEARFSGIFFLFGFLFHGEASFPVLCPEKKEESFGWRGSGRISEIRTMIPKIRNFRFSFSISVGALVGSKPFSTPLVRN